MVLVGWRVALIRFIEFVVHQFFLYVSFCFRLR